MTDAVLTPRRATDRIPELGDRDFTRFQALIGEAAGIALGEAKRPLLVGRLSRRLRELELDSFGAYYKLVVGDTSGEELIRLLDLVATNETSFFREPAHFEYLTTRIIPAWKLAAERGERARTVRVWSAACSTGQEPFSLAMLLLAHLPADEGWHLEVLGTDISTRALRVCAEATWPVAQASLIPSDLLSRWMLRGTGAREGVMRASPELRAVVRCVRLNLHDERWPAAGPFDLVFCRNVLIYFSPEGSRRVVTRLAERLAPGGHLFVGHAESIHGTCPQLRPVAPTIYRDVRR